MQYRLLLQLFSILLVFIFSLDALQAQKIAKNRNGEQIIIFPDGNWEKFDKKNQKHVAILKSYKKDLEDKNKTEDLKEKGLSETKGERLKRIAQENVDNAEDDLQLAEERVSEAKYNRISLEDDLEELKDDENAKAHEISYLENKIKGSKEVEARAKKHLKVAKKSLKASRKILTAYEPAQKKKKKMNSSKSGRKSNKDTESYSTLTAEAKQYAQYDINKDVMYNPPQSDCGFLFYGVDEFLGKNRKDVNLGTFFTHTDDEMRKFLGNKEYLECEGNFTQIEGGILLLNLHYSIASRDAARTFGGFSKGSMVTMKFISGNSIKLVNTKDVSGQYDPLTERHTFVAQYIVSVGQEKALRKGELDKVRVIWKTGFEDYEIYDVDFLKNQLHCLSSK